MCEEKHVPTAKDYVMSALDEDNRKHLEIFRQMCLKFDISWSKATDQERAFIEEITRVTFERYLAKKNGTPLSDIRPFFG